MGESKVKLESFLSGRLRKKPSTASRSTAKFLKNKTERWGYFKSERILVSK